MAACIGADFLLPIRCAALQAPRAMKSSLLPFLALVSVVPLVANSGCVGYHLLAAAVDKSGPKARQVTGAMATSLLLQAGCGSTRREAPLGQAD